MLVDYKKSKKSRVTFKENLHILANSLEQTDGERVQPIVVIVDELDRCRPDYAISLLEEIKHLFDVPGITFLIALHGEQLTHSINAVYGEKFNGSAYLRRFFSRTYKLRRLSLGELVTSHFESIPYSNGTFNYPQISQGSKPSELKADRFSGELLSEWLVTPREAQSVVDGLRLFVDNWDLPVPIDLPLALLLLVHLVRNEPLEINTDSFEKRRVSSIQIVSQKEADRMGRVAYQSHRIEELITLYHQAAHSNLLNYREQNSVVGLDGYVAAQMQREHITLHNGVHINNAPPPRTTWSDYIDRVGTLGPFIEEIKTEEEQEEAKTD